MAEVRLTREKLVREYGEALAQIPNVQESTRAVLVDIFEQSLLEWETAIVDRLAEKAALWEQIDPTEGTLYSLGIRHAQDIVLGQEVDINKSVPGTEGDAP